MAIGERIKFIRNLHGATQKWLGLKLGFSEKTAETRVGQYEIGVRTPKDEMIKDIANMTGFKTVQHFSRVFKSQTGATPAEFRKSAVQKRKDDLNGKQNSRA